VRHTRTVLVGLAILTCLLVIHIAKAQVASEAADLTGRWVGRGRGTTGFTWSLEIVVDAQGRATSTYGLNPRPEDVCALIRIEDANGRLRFQEQSKTNPDACNAVLDLEQETPSRLVFRRVDADGTTLNATGELVLTPPSVPIVTDGDFNDWNGVPVAYRAPTTFGDEPHVTTLRVAADERFLFLQLDLNRSLNTAALGRTISVLLDADGDPTTGRTVYGLPGADLAVEMSPAPSEDTGFVVHWIPEHGGDVVDVSPDAIGLLVAPSYASSRVEMRVDRHLMPHNAGSGPLLASTKATLKLVLNQDLIAWLDYGTGRNVQQETAPVSVTLPPFVPARTRAATEPFPAIDPIARASGTELRVATWNVSALPPQRRELFAKVLRAIDADVLMLNETRDRMSATELEQWLGTVTPGGDQTWHVLQSQGTVVAVRADLAEAFGPLTYRMAEVERLLPTVQPLDRQASVAESLETDSIHVSGARVTLNGRTLLVVPLQLVCCGGSPNSVNEARRMIEAQHIRSAVSAAVANLRPDAILVGGDLNLIATRGPLDTLQGPGIDNAAPWSVARALQLDGRTSDTWRSLSASSQFPPARMDWLLFSGSDFEQLGGFTFDTEDLSPFWLTQHALNASDSRASDHLPIVADFRWRR
jgi:exonuclease III